LVSILTLGLDLRADARLDLLMKKVTILF